jgi:TolA-binding protein
MERNTKGKNKKIKDNRQQMKGLDKNNNQNSSQTTRHNSWDDPGFEMLLTPTDIALFGEISDYMKGLSDIEDVKSDPAYSITNDEVKVMISNHQKNSIQYKENEKFIHESFAEAIQEKKLKKEIAQIKHEISQNNLNDISSELVKEWQEKRQRNNSKDLKTEENRNFITMSLEEKEISRDIRSEERKRKGLSKSLITRYTSLAAAAIIGAVFLIRSLLPSDDPQKIFSKYYQPFHAVSSVTRGSGTSENESFANAVGSYKSADYQSAATGFSEAVFNGSASYSASFFLGITEIELGNYNKAIDLLGEVMKLPGQYAKESTWYLGLAYIKSGNKVKASECFEILARSPGFYSDRSEKILRRLK